jgi:hypothetical protein
VSRPYAEFDYAYTSLEMTTNDIQDEMAKLEPQVQPTGRGRPRTGVKVTRYNNLKEELEKRSSE